MAVPPQEMPGDLTNALSFYEIKRNWAFAFELDKYIFFFEIVLSTERDLAFMRSVNTEELAVLINHRINFKKYDGCFHCFVLYDQCRKLTYTYRTSFCALPLGDVCITYLE